MLSATGPSSRAISVDETPAPISKTFYYRQMLDRADFSRKTVINTCPSKDPGLL